MKEELTKIGFINAWNGVPGYSLEPYMNYCRKIINICRPKYHTPRWLGSPDEIVEMSLTDVLQTVHDKIDQFDENKGTFNTFLYNYSHHAYTDYLRKQKAFSKMQEFEDGIINLLNIEENAPEPIEKNPYQILAEEETKRFKQDVIKKIIKIVSDFSPREREIFEAEYPTIDIQVDTLAKICTLL